MASPSAMQRTQSAQRQQSGQQLIDLSDKFVRLSKLQELREKSRAGVTHIKLQNAVLADNRAKHEDLLDEMQNLMKNLAPTLRVADF